MGNSRNGRALRNRLCLRKERNLIPSESAISSGCDSLMPVDTTMRNPHINIDILKFIDFMKEILNKENTLLLREVREQFWEKNGSRLNREVCRSYSKFLRPRDHLFTTSLHNF